MPPTPSKGGQGTVGSGRQSMRSMAGCVGGLGKGGCGAGRADGRGAGAWVGVGAEKPPAWAVEGANEARSHRSIRGMGGWFHEG